MMEPGTLPPRRPALLELQRLGDPTAHRYSVRVAGFADDHGRLDVGVELEHADALDEGSPPEISIRLASLPWDGAPAALSADGPHDFGLLDSTRPRAFVYSGFHHSTVQVRLRIASAADDQLRAEIRVETDDVERYDAAATRTTIGGPLILRRMDRPLLWHP